MPDHRLFSACLTYLVGLAVLLLGAPAVAATLADVSCCDDLDDAQRARAESIMAQQYLYDCCDDTVATCLAQSEPCPLAKRLTGEICRRVEHGYSDADVDQALKLRARSMMPGGPVTDIDLAGAPVIGEPDAPVVLVEYACMRCPFCARMTLALLDELEPGGALHGKVRLYYKLFPLKGHSGSVEGGLAALAAQDQGRFWEFLRLSYDRFGAFSVDALPSWAAEVGLDPDQYAASIADPATRQRLVAAKREGIANGVTATPTLYINGRMFQSRLEVDQVLDMLQEEHERLTATP